MDGVIAFGAFTAPEMDFLRSLSFAIVFVNSDQHNYEFDQIQVDFDQGLKQMAAYLLDKKQYRGIGYIGGVYEHGGVRIGGRRLSGLRRILEERGLYDPTVFHVGDISRESGYTLARQAAREGRLAEAMLLGSDEVAEGALEAFRELGLRVPKDVAVIIYQDIQTLESKWPTGTCIEMFPDYIWENALEILFGRISQKRTQAVTVVVTHAHPHRRYGMSAFPVARARRPLQYICHKQENTGGPNMKKSVSLLLAGAMCAGLLAGCSSSSTSGGASAAASSSTAPSSVVSGEAGSKSIEKLSIAFVPSREPEEIITATEPLKEMLTAELASLGYDVGEVEILCGHQL